MVESPVRIPSLFFHDTLEMNSLQTEVKPDVNKMSMNVHRLKIQKIKWKFQAGRFLPLESLIFNRMCEHSIRTFNNFGVRMVLKCLIRNC